MATVLQAGVVGPTRAEYQQRNIENLGQALDSLREQVNINRANAWKRVTDMLSSADFGVASLGDPAFADALSKDIGIAIGTRNPEKVNKFMSGAARVLMSPEKQAQFDQAMMLSGRIKAEDAGKPFDENEFLKEFEGLWQEQEKPVVTATPAAKKSASNAAPAAPVAAPAAAPVAAQPVTERFPISFRTSAEALAEAKKLDPNASARFLPAVQGWVITHPQNGLLMGNSADITDRAPGSGVGSSASWQNAGAPAPAQGAGTSVGTGGMDFKTWVEGMLKLENPGITLDPSETGESLAARYPQLLEKYKTNRQQMAPNREGTFIPHTPAPGWDRTGLTQELDVNGNPVRVGYYSPNAPQVSTPTVPTPARPQAGAQATPMAEPAAPAAPARKPWEDVYAKLSDRDKLIARYVNKDPAMTDAEKTRVRGILDEAAAQAQADIRVKFRAGTGWDKEVLDRAVYGLNLTAAPGVSLADHPIVGPLFYSSNELAKQKAVAEINKVVSETFENQANTRLLNVEADNYPLKMWIEEQKALKEKATAESSAYREVSSAFMQEAAPYWSGLKVALDALGKDPNDKNLQAQVDQYQKFIHSLPTYKELEKANKALQAKATGSTLTSGAKSVVQPKQFALFKWQKPDGSYEYYSLDTGQQILNLGNTQEGGAGVGGVPQTEAEKAASYKLK